MLAGALYTSGVVVPDPVIVAKPVSTTSFVVKADTDKVDPVVCHTL